MPDPQSFPPLRGNPVDRPRALACVFAVSRRETELYQPFRLFVDPARRACADQTDATFHLAGERIACQGLDRYQRQDGVRGQRQFHGIVTILLFGARPQYS